nr:immunoglobulin heavy chain junction region [Macaca mulatta]MOW99858.1 immunoglobulin heavy chain junction region [Macaca mulatta]MOX03062.1 immunoglobulin heavy chain junction region [Macaca mulatta]MOX04654.1 immunoglobulin heavy chain junction region [Macaca mulatta]MOX04810.1 immunoglobulin heavy chain junction region [Macaca mulatta]
CARDHSNFDSW